MPDTKTLAEKWEKEKQKENDENDTRLNAVKDFQSKQHNHTCMMPRDMAADIIENVLLHIYSFQVGRWKN